MHTQTQTAERANGNDSGIRLTPKGLKYAQAHEGLPKGVRRNPKAMAAVRRDLEAKIEAAIEALDQLEGDPDGDGTDDGDSADDQGDDEPSLGAVEWLNQDKAWESCKWAGRDDAEDEHDGSEHTLGATEAVNQALSWGYEGGGLEGDDLDTREGESDEDREPSLGSPNVWPGAGVVGGPRDEGLDQRNWSLGFTNDGEASGDDEEGDWDEERLPLWDLPQVGNAEGAAEEARRLLASIPNRRRLYFGDNVQPLTGDQIVRGQHEILILRDDGLWQGWKLPRGGRR